MTLSGHDFWFALIVAVAAGVAAIVVGLRLANPIATDLAEIGATVKAVSEGDRKARTGINRGDEVGQLASSVDDLSRSLRRAEREREVADEERNSVVGAISHDLRTPLASLLVSIDAIEDEVGDARSHLRAMRGNVLTLEQLVEDLFLLARADSGRLALNLERLDLSELIDEALEAMAPVAARRNVQLLTTLNEPLQVEGDPTALGRVFRNLLDNAVRHSPAQGEVLVDYDVEDYFVRVVVTDQGDGFDPEFVAQALDRFTQADPARSRSGSAGLGLSIANALVQAHGGVVEIEPGPGARVCVGLPLKSDRASVRERV